MSSLSISRAWDETSSFLRREARLVVPVALAAFVVPSTIVQWIEPGGPAASSSQSGLALPLVLASLLFAIVGQMSIAILAIGWQGSVGEALSLAVKRVWGVLAALILVFLPISLVFAVAVGVVVVSAGLTDPAAVTPQALARVPQVGLIFLLLLLAMLFASVRLFPLSAVAMAEGAGPFRLLARCWALTKGNFWRLLATLLLIFVVSAVLGGAVTYVGGALVSLTIGRIEPLGASALIIALLAAIVGAAISAVGASLVGRIYVQLNAAHPGVPDVKRED
jgi:hypothetical protein